MKDFHSLLTCNKPVDKLDAYEALKALYKSCGLRTPEGTNFIFLPNLVDCVNWVRHQKLSKTSIKDILYKTLTDSANQNRRSRGNRDRTIQDIQDNIKNKLLLQSNIYVMPQVNQEGFDLIMGNAYHTKLTTDVCALWTRIYENVPFFIPLLNHCVISGSWLQVHTLTNNNNFGAAYRLHRDGMEPAVHILGNDKFNMYYKNGVRLSPKWFKVPPEHLDAQEILNVPNVEQRMELMRHVGMELLLKNLKHRVISKSDDGVYELLQIAVDISRGNRVPVNLENTSDKRRVRDTFREEANWIYLKMINPSTGTYHVEAVHPECRTVNDALLWRAEEVRKWLAKNETWAPEQLT